MHLTSLALTNWRNFRRVEAIEFPQPSLLVAAAPNTTGKTNFLESIIVLLRGKSWRASLEQCVRWGEDHCAIQGAIQHRQHLANVSLRFQLNPRRLKIEEDGVPISPLAFYTQYPLISFLPEDTFLLTRGPAGRRNFANQALATVPAYLSSLVQYHRVVRQRNLALRSASAAAAVQGWTDLLVEYALPIWQQRLALIDFLSSHLGGVYSDLLGETIPFSIRLAPGLPSSAVGPISIAAYQGVVERAWPYEKRYTYTLYGPHRDDFEVMVEDRSASQILSRGQMRGLVLALKIAVWQFTKQLTGEGPIMLLDDVLSELDEPRQQSLLEHLPSGQILLTCTTVPPILTERSLAQFLDLRALLHVAPTRQPAHAR